MNQFRMIERLQRNRQWSMSLERIHEGKSINSLTENEPRPILKPDWWAERFLGWDQDANCIVYEVLGLGVEGLEFELEHKGEGTESVSMFVNSVWPLLCRRLAVFGRVKKLMIESKLRK